MSRLENEFNKRFHNQKLSGDDFDTEGLWDDISSDLEVAPAVGKPSFWNMKWLGMGVGALLLVGAIGFASRSEFGTSFRQTNQPKSNQNVTHLNSNVEHRLSNEDDAIQNIEADLTTHSSKEGKNQTAEGAVVSTEKTDLEARVNQQTTHSEKTTTAKGNAPHHFPKGSNSISKSEIRHSNSNLNNTTSLSQNEFNSNEFGEQGNVSTNSIGNASLSETTESLESTNSQSTSTNRDEFEKSTLPMIAIKNCPEFTSGFELEQEAKPSTISLNTEATKPQKTNSASPWQLELVGGANVIDFKTRSTLFPDIAQARDDAQKLYPGASFGLHLGYQINEKWLLNSGLEYHQLWSKFDYQESKDVDVLKEDQLLRVWISTTSGDTLNQLRGDTTITAQSIRDVVHYNQYNRLSIPLEFGFRQNAGQLIYGVSAGAVFNFTLSQSGKIIEYTGNVIGMDEGESAKFGLFDFGVRVRPVLGFKVKDQWTITLQPHWMWSFSPEIGVDKDIRTQNHQFNLNLGVGYDF